MITFQVSGGGGGGGGGGIMAYAIEGMQCFFIEQVKSPYFITQGMGQSSMFLTFRTICNLGGGLGL